MKISKISNIVTTVTKKASKTSTIKSVPIQTALPLVSIPLVAYASLKGIRDSRLTDYCNKAITELKKQLNNGNITQSEYNSHVREVKNYYDNAKDLPADVSSSTIKQGEPSFRGDDSDYGVYDGNNDDGCCDCDSDDDCCDSDSDCGSGNDCCDSDSDCDSGDALLSSC